MQENCLRTEAALDSTGHLRRENSLQKSGHSVRSAAQPKAVEQAQIWKVCENDATVIWNEMECWFVSGKRSVECSTGCSSRCRCVWAFWTCTRTGIPPKLMDYPKWLEWVRPLPHRTWDSPDAATRTGAISRPTNDPDSSSPTFRRELFR